MTALPSREQIVHDIRVAAARDDAVALTKLLHPDVVAVTDGGGDVLAPTIALRGHDEVVPETLANLSPGAGVVTEHQVNGAPALVVRRAGRVVAIVSFGFADGLVTHLWITRSPHKLRRWNESH